MSGDSSPAPTSALERRPFAIWQRRGPRELIAKRAGELTRLECDADLIETILETLDARPTLEELAGQLALEPASLSPVVEALIQADLVRLVEEPVAQEPNISTVAFIGETAILDQITRLLTIAGASPPERVRLPHEPDGSSDSAASGMGLMRRELSRLSRPLLVGAPLNASMAQLALINQWCLELNIPWLPLYHDGSAMHLGPTVIPHKTPCFACMLRRLSRNCRIVSPSSLDLSSYETLRETWPAPDSGVQAVRCLQTVCRCVEEILLLQRDGALPTLIGRQLITDLDADGASPPRIFEFEMSDHCIDRLSRPSGTAAETGVSTVPARRMMHSQTDEARSRDGGLRSVGQHEARHRIGEAFERYGHTFSVRRCRFGPLGHLPSYRSFSTGRLSKDTPFIVPRSCCTGKGVTEEQAYLSAAYEMAERVSAAFHGQLELVRARHSEVRDSAVDPASLTGTPFLDLPGYDRPEDDPVIDWVRGVSLISGRSLLVPASAVFFPLLRCRGVFKAQWSGGLAAGAVIDDAILHGLTERIEHDAWAIWQMNRITCPRVDLNSIDDGQARQLIRQIHDAGLRVIVRDRRTDINVPVFRAWIINDRTPQAFACRGDGAALDRGIALTRALTEAQHKLAFPDERSWSQVLHRPSAQLLQDGRSLHHLSALAPFELADDPATINFSSICADSQPSVPIAIRTIVTELVSRVDGIEIVAVDLTEPLLGIPTVRVVVAGLQEMAKPWTHILPRAFELPVRLGRRARPLQYHELYLGPFPH